MDIPKYLQIENELKKEIISGKFKYGDKFYSEAQLKEKDLGNEEANDIDMDFVGSLERYDTSVPEPFKNFSL